MLTLAWFSDRADVRHLRKRVLLSGDREFKSDLIKKDQTRIMCYHGISSLGDAAMAEGTNDGFSSVSMNAFREGWAE